MSSELTVSGVEIEPANLQAQCTYEWLVMQVGIRLSLLRTFTAQLIKFRVSRFCVQNNSRETLLDYPH
jgi:hypothetical protein